jgi:hypothetical protein
VPRSSRLQFDGFTPQQVRIADETAGTELLGAMAFGRSDTGSLIQGRFALCNFDCAHDRSD